MLMLDNEVSGFFHLVSIVLRFFLKLRGLLKVMFLQKTIETLIRRHRK